MQLTDEMMGKIRGAMGFREDADTFDQCDIVRGYVEAAEGVVDLTQEGDGNPYYAGRHDYAQVIPGTGKVMVGPDAEEVDPSEARERADELRFLADLAELTA